MASLNPFQIISMIQSKGPQAAAEEIINTNFPNNPMMNNLLQMGYKGDITALEQIAQQYCNQNGRNFEQEMNQLMAMMGTRR